MSATWKAKPTAYASNAFRSRLEARWAAFFDLIHWQWTYEPLDADGYIPDFLIHGDTSFYVEVGPCIDRAEYEAKAEKPSRSVSLLQRNLLIVGVSPVVTDVLVSQNFAGETTAGWFGEYFGPDGEPHGECYDWAPAAWRGPYGQPSKGDEWRSLAVYHTLDNYATMPWATDRGWKHPEVPESYLLDLWGQAGSATQWKP